MQSVFEDLRENCRSLWCPSAIKRISNPSQEEFFREYVATSTPVVISGILGEWANSDHWTQVYMIERAGDMSVTVDITPNGHGDCVVPVNGESLFVKPQERKMSLKDFFFNLKDSRFDGVPYLSHQNSSLTKELPCLAKGIDKCLSLAKKCFGNDPEAVNIWIGDDRAVSSCHKDHYENMYCVVQGEKHFILLPPSDILFLYQKMYLSARYAYSLETGWKIEKEDTQVSWISVDPGCMDLKKYPLLEYATPLHCIVRPGETLYLPALWYHQVSQKGFTVAINYWHDMAYDQKYVYHNFLMDIAPQLQPLIENIEETYDGDDRR